MDSRRPCLEIDHLYHAIIKLTSLSCAQRLVFPNKEQAPPIIGTALARLLCFHSCNIELQPLSDELEYLRKVLVQVALVNTVRARCL